MEGLFRAWWSIMTGRQPCLSIEVTRECPLSCPGCYAYDPEHLGESATLRDAIDYRGDELVSRILALVRAERPVNVSLVGGEPLVRYREMSRVLPELARMGIFTQVVTSAVRPIPAEWRAIPRLRLAVSIDGLQPEHDARRKPATYERILKHIEGHRITVHWTVTRQQLRRAGYVEDFVRFWSGLPSVTTIWVSLYTPQLGELSDERLTPADREHVVREFQGLHRRYPKLAVGPVTLQGYLHPPKSPRECVFAQVTRCVSADFRQPVTPCQLGGRPDCENCGCMASAGLTAVCRYRLPAGPTIGSIFRWSQRTGEAVKRVRRAFSSPAVTAAPSE